MARTTTATFFLVLFGVFLSGRVANAVSLTPGDLLIGGFTPPGLVIEVDGSGDFLGGFFADPLNPIQGLAVAPNGEVLLSSFRSVGQPGPTCCVPFTEITRWDSTGALLGSFLSKPVSSQDFDLTPNGDVLLLDGTRIFRFDQGGALVDLLSFSIPTSFIPQTFPSIGGFAVADNGDILIGISDANAHIYDVPAHLVRLDSEGGFLESFSVPVFSIVELAVALNGDVLVGNGRSSEVVRLTPDGALLTRFSVPSVGFAGLDVMSPIPEPGTLTLVGCGAAVLAAMRRGRVLRRELATEKPRGGSLVSASSMAVRSSAQGGSGTMTFLFSDFVHVAGPPLYSNSRRSISFSCAAKSTEA